MCQRTERISASCQNQCGDETRLVRLRRIFQPPVALNNGKAKLKLKKLTVGSHVIVAVYSGSIDFNSSTSPPFTQVIS